MSSRWLEVPGHVTENPGDLPAGFRAAGRRRGHQAQRRDGRRAAGVLGARTA